MSKVVFGETIMCPFCKGRGHVGRGATKGRGRICRGCQGGGTQAGEGVSCWCRCGCRNMTRIIVCVVCVTRTGLHGKCLGQLIDVSDLQPQEEYESAVLKAFSGE